MNFVYAESGCDCFFEDVFCFFADVFFVAETGFPFVHFFVEVLADVKPVLVFPDVEVVEFAGDLVECIAEYGRLLSRLNASKEDTLTVNSFFEVVLAAWCCSEEDGSCGFSAGEYLTEALVVLFDFLCFGSFSVDVAVDDRVPARREECEKFGFYFACQRKASGHDEVVGVSVCPEAGDDFGHEFEDTAGSLEVRER